MSTKNLLPKSFTSTIQVTINNYTIDGVMITPFIRATVIITLYDTSGITYPRTFVLSGDDYANWGSGDTYLTDYVSNNIEQIFDNNI